MFAYVGEVMIKYSSLFFHRSELCLDTACSLEQRAVMLREEYIDLKFKIKIFIDTENFLVPSY